MTEFNVKLTSKTAKSQSSSDSQKFGVYDTFGRATENEQVGVVHKIFIFFIFHLLYLVVPVFMIATPLACLFSSNAYVKYGAAVYLICYLTTFDGRHKKMGSPWPWLVNLSFVRGAIEWLPIVIRRTVTLDSDQLYVFACHPHGTLAFNRGGVGFATDTLWDAAFPGVKFRVLTATAAFFIPFIREMWLWSYCVDASKATAVNVMKNHKSSVFVYPGGEKEQLETIKGRHRVFLKERKGFVKLAMEQGAHLVPVYAFGETDLYNHSQFMIGFRKWLVKTCGVAVPLLHGQYGLMPFRTKVTLVFGAPVIVKPIEKPSHEEIDKVHREYVKALQALFEAHKHDLGYGDKELEIL